VVCGVSKNCTAFKFRVLEYLTLKYIDPSKFLKAWAVMPKVSDDIARSQR
jgi:hypothetical protein